ncbi:MAG: S41 family peptidase [Bacteroidales bacterium]|nr:S41 family peptidase [Bacteroidales bacterium]
MSDDLENIGNSEVPSDVTPSEGSTQPDKRQGKGYALLSVLLLVGIGLLGGLLIGSLHSKRNNVTIEPLYSDQVNAVLQTIEDHYVENIDIDSLTTIMIQSTLASLDPHSNYLTAKEAAKEDEQIRGNFEGIGATLIKRNDTIVVVNVFEESPARKAGLRTGDCILSVDGVAITGVEMAMDEAVKHIRGPHHTQAFLTVLRHGEKKARNIIVTRDVIDNPSLVLSAMMDNEVGYIRINNFSSTTYKEFCKAVASLKASGMKDLILDLRDNSGGLLHTAIQLIDELLPGNELIMYSEGAHQSRRVFHSKPGGLFVEGRLAVMINEFSASASEVVSGAIQDNDRGIIVGRRSFGKGLVQQEYSLPDRSVLMLTVAHYFTPSGRCIQRSYKDGIDEYYASFVGQILTDYETDSIHAIVNDSTPYYTQKGRVVYGGGGIFPDHVIRHRNDASYNYCYMLQSRYVFSDVSTDYVTRHYDELVKAYPTRDAFLKNYTPNQAYIDLMVADAKRKGVAYDAAGMKAHRDEILCLLKAHTGSLLYSGDTYYRILYRTDNEIADCLRLLKAQPRYRQSTKR